MNYYPKILPFYMTYPMPLIWEEEDTVMRDLTFFQFFTAFDTHFVYSSVHHRLHTDAFLYFIRRIRKMLVFFQGNFI